jgi:phospholipid/cholesterol/gamma-HCH transport system substrate-binding protein
MVLMQARTAWRASRRRLVALPVLAVLVVALAGCSASGGGGQRTATAVFSDVGDLSSGAQVQLADVPVGSVQSIALDGNKAKVTLAFDNNVRIPADVSAAINRTTILGDQFVQLNVPKTQTGAAAATAPQLADGATIAHTSLVPDV